MHIIAERVIGTVVSLADDTDDWWCMALRLVHHNIRTDTEPTIRHFMHECTHYLRNWHRTAPLTVCTLQICAISHGPVSLHC